MKLSPKYFFIISTLFIIAGCAGTGTKNLSSITSQIETSGEGKVFVIRDDSFVGGGVMMKVVLNNIEIGELGAGEMIYAKANQGKNSMKIRIGGLIGEESVVSFVNNGKDHNFFLARLKSGFFSSELKITETTESAWKLESQNK